MILFFPICGPLSRLVKAVRTNEYKSILRLTCSFQFCSSQMKASSKQARKDLETCESSIIHRPIRRGMYTCRAIPSAISGFRTYIEAGTIFWHPMIKRQIHEGPSWSKTWPNVIRLDFNDLTNRELRFFIRFSPNKGENTIQLYKNITPAVYCHDVLDFRKVLSTQRKGWDGQLKGAPVGTNSGWCMPWYFATGPIFHAIRTWDDARFLYELYNVGTT